MIRRLARALRQQDWAGVMIEFFIVVVGIFVGLQVTQWNEERQARARELNYLDRLHEDLVVMRREFGYIRAQASQAAPRALRTFRALRGCDPALASTDDVQRTFAGYQNQPAASIVDRTYQEMLSSGALASMDDRALSGEIAGLFSELYDYRSFISSVRISLPVIDEIMWRHIDLSYDDSGIPVLAGFDFANACRTRELRNALWEVYDLMWDWEQGTAQTAESVEALATRLDVYLTDRGARSP